MNIEQTAHGSETCIHHLFEVQVKRAPEKTAVIWQEQSFTYGMLNMWAERLAHHLQGVGVGPETLVGIYMERSPYLVAALLAVFKSGGAYVPLDPHYPPARNEFMLADAQAKVVLTSETLAASVPSFEGPVLTLEPLLQDEGETAMAPVITSGNRLAYLIYTSGSTGKPKGAAITHQGAVTMLRWAREMYSDEDLSGLLAVTSVCFDISIFELFAPLSWGGTVILVNNALDLLSLPDPSIVKLVDMVPSAMTEILKAGRLPDSVRTVNLAGEALKQKLVQRVHEHPQVERVINLYGPSEDTTFSTFAVMGKNVPAIPPIGHPIINTQIHLLDEHFEPVPYGQPGEVYLGGAGVSRGYFRRPGQTAGKYIPNPFSQEAGQRLYKTGDLAFYRPDGQLQFISRIDHQVKVRGYRIELGEIETTLHRCEQLEDAVVIVREDIPGDKRLAAYVVPQGEPPTAEVLRQHLARTLPDYMLPTYYITLPALPLTPNGKVNRFALPAPDMSRPDMSSRYRAPETDLQAQLVTIWQSVIGLEQVGIDDNFFELGGHSLAAIKIIAWVQDELQARLSVETIFKAPTIAQMAEAVKVAVAAGGTEVVTPAPKEAVLPLAVPQEQIWFLEQLYPDIMPYNFQATLRFKGDLNKDALQQSLNEIVRRHEIFRTTFPSQNGHPVQVVHEPWPVPLPLVDLRKVPAGEREAALEAWLAQEFRIASDITKLPLLRWTLLQMEEQEYVLAHVEHHLVHDGWSFNVFLRELLRLYQGFHRGEPVSLPELPIQFGDYAYWQRAWEKGPAAQGQLDYWREQLAGSTSLLPLPTDYPRPEVPTFRGNVLRIELPVDLCQDLRAFSRNRGVTLYMTMLAAFYVLLHRYTSETDINVGAGLANRRQRELEGMIGMLVNMVVLRTDLAGNPSFGELVQRVRDVTLAAYAHQEVPFEQVVETLHPERNPSYNPIFQVAFSFHDSPLPELTLPGLELSMKEALSNGSSKFDINIISIPRFEQQMGRRHRSTELGVTVLWEYSSDLFAPETMERMVSHYQAILRQVVAHPAIPLSAISMLTVTEQEMLLQRRNETAVAYPHTTVQEQFEAQVARTPAAIAVVADEMVLTYEQLNERANQLARYLQQQGVRPGQNVGIGMERSVEMLVAELAVLKAGGTYVPLDPSYPLERLAFMVADTKTAVLLTLSHLDEQIRQLPQADSLQVIYVDQEATAIANQMKVNLPHSLDETAVAYIMYTSGSTGRPKGILIPHRAINRLVLNSDYIQLTATDRVAHLSNVSFDASTFEIWGALLNGARVVLIPWQVAISPAELVAYWQDKEITTLFLTTALFNQLAYEQPDCFKTLTHVLFGGEAVDPRAVRQILAGEPPQRLLHVYGPTESTTYATWHLVEAVAEEAATVPIGRPLANTTVYVLDAYRQPVPVGVPGELYVGGDGLAHGYLDRPSLTADHFVPHPFAMTPGARLYKTGDLVQLDETGAVVFIGRRDYQVKVRGFRIELGEIESVVWQHPDVNQVMVMVRQDGVQQDKRVVAYVVPRPEVVLTAADLRRFLKSKVPDYMVPAAFVMMTSLPLTPNGKVDKKALPAPEDVEALVAVETYVPPRTPVEEQLASIWGEFLGQQRIGVYDNFFDLGGHSLLATQIMAQVTAAFRVELPLLTLFQAPTVAGLSDAIMQETFEATDEAELAALLGELEGEF